MATSLCLHSGGQLAIWEQVTQVETPEGTKTFYPVPHHNLVDTIAEQLQNHGYALGDVKHALSKNGQRYFGLMRLNHDSLISNDYCMVLGIRNSHDQSFKAGIVAGSQVFVCDNLAFNGQVSLSRKHTRFIMRDLPVLANSAVDKLYGHFRHQIERYDAYKETALDDLHAKAAIVDACRQGILGSDSIPKVYQEWAEPSHEEFAQKRNVWRFFNAVTEIAKQWSAPTLEARTRRLHVLCNSLIAS